MAVPAIANNTCWKVHLDGLDHIRFELVIFLKPVRSPLRDPPEELEVDFSFWVCFFAMVVRW